MRSVLAAVLFISFHSFAFAQDNRPPIHRADQISMTIDHSLSRSVTSFLPYALMSLV
jgi:hypothetical protein